MVSQENVSLSDTRNVCKRQLYLSVFRLCVKQQTRLKARTHSSGLCSTEDNEALEASEKHVQKHTEKKIIQSTIRAPGNVVQLISLHPQVHVVKGN